MQLRPIKILDIASGSKDQAYWVKLPYTEISPKDHQRRQAFKSSRSMLQIEWFLKLYICGKTDMEMRRVVGKVHREVVRADFLAVQ